MCVCVTGGLKVRNCTIAFHCFFARILFSQTLCVFHWCSMYYIFEDDEVMSFAEIIILRILFSSFCLFCFYYCLFVFCFFDSHIYMVCYKRRSKGYKAAHSIHIHAHTISHITHIPLYCMKCANTSISFIHHMKWMCVTKTTSVIRSYYPTNFYESIIH